MGDRRLLEGEVSPHDPFERVLELLVGCSVAEWVQRTEQNDKIQAVKHFSSLYNIYFRYIFHPFLNIKQSL